VNARAHAAPGRLLLHGADIFADLVGALQGLSSGMYQPAYAHDAIALSTGLAVAALLLYTRYALGHPWLSAPAIYMALFWMFHFGLSFTAVLVPDVLLEFDRADIDWLHAPNVRAAMLLAVAGAAGFVGSAGIFGSRRGATVAGVPRHEGDRTLYRAGWLLLVGGMAGAAWFMLTRGGFGIFSMGYLDLRVEVLGATPAPLAIDAAQLGCSFAICGARGREWIKPAAAWGVLGVMLLALGLRTEALVPMLTFVVLIEHRGIRIPRGIMAAALAVALLLIPMIKVVRLVGFANRDQVPWTAVSPLGTLTELGGTLRAAKAYVDWIEDGDPYLMGATYWAPIDRQVLTRVIPGRTPIAREDDPRLPSRNIDLEGAVGLAATGEAFYNFGDIGPFLFYAAVGLVLGWAEARASRTPYAGGVLAVFMIIFFFNIRGEWLPVPGRIGLGCGVLALCHMLGRPRRVAMQPALDA
jgi:hypothetical protein